MANSKITLELDAKLDNVSPCTGTLPCKLRDAATFVEGKLAANVEVVVAVDTTVTTSTTHAIDFTTILDVRNQAFLPTGGDISAFMIVNDGPGDIEITVPAGTPWIGWLKAVGDVNELKAGMSVAVNAAPVGALPVSAGAKNIELTETGTGDAAIRYQFWGRRP